MRFEKTGEIIEEYRETVDYLKNKYSSKPLQIPLTHIISACRLIESNTVVKVCLAGISLLYISKPEKGYLFPLLNFFSFHLDQLLLIEIITDNSNVNKEDNVMGNEIINAKSPEEVRENLF